MISVLFLTVGWKIFNRKKVLSLLKKEVGEEDEYRRHFLRLLLYFKILGEASGTGFPIRFIKGRWEKWIPLYYSLE